MVQTINNIRSRTVGVGLPRMVLGRALLDCTSLDDAVRLLQTSQRASAFHMTLAQRGDPRVISVEFTHSRCSVVTIEQPRCHANHLVHKAMTDQLQVVTASSLSRQRRGDQIINAAPSVNLDPLTVLWDRSAPALPIYRAQSDDPDGENTLATAVFDIGETVLEWRVYDRASGTPRFTMSGDLPLNRPRTVTSLDVV